MSLENLSGEVKKETAQIKLCRFPDAILVIGDTEVHVSREKLAESDFLCTLFETNIGKDTHFEGTQKYFIKPSDTVNDSVCYNTMLRWLHDKITLEEIYTVEKTPDLTTVNPYRIIDFLLINDEWQCKRQEILLEFLTEKLSILSLKGILTFYNDAHKLLKLIKLEKGLENMLLNRIPSTMTPELWGQFIKIENIHLILAKYSIKLIK